MKFQRKGGNLFALLQIHHQAVMTRDEDILEKKKKKNNIKTSKSPETLQ